MQINHNVLYIVHSDGFRYNRMMISKVKPLYKKVEETTAAIDGAEHRMSVLDNKRKVIYHARGTKCHISAPLNGQNLYRMYEMKVCGTKRLVC